MSDYPVLIRTRAIEHRRAGWKMSEILNLLEREYGHRPAQSTLSRWCDDGQRQHDATTKHRRAARRRAVATGGRFLRMPQSPEFKLARMRALHDEAGLKVQQVARVMAFDFGDEITGAQVRHAFETGRYPKVFA